MNTRILAMCVSLIGLTAGPTLASSMWWQPYTSDANTLGLWHFDEVTGSSTTFADSGPGANNGTFVAGASSPVASGAGTGPGAGMFGTALKLADGSQPSWGSVPDDNTDMEPAGDFTIEAWVKPDADDLGGGTESYVIGKRDGGASWNFGFLFGRLYFEANAPGYAYVLDDLVVTADTWYHIAAVYDGATFGVDLYLNDALVATGNLGGAIVANDSALQFGSRGSTGNSVNYGGTLDEVRYSNVKREFGPAVPEPSSVALLLLGSVALLRQRGRR